MRSYAIGSPGRDCFSFSLFDGVLPTTGDVLARFALVCGPSPPPPRGTVRPCPLPVFSERVDVVEISRVVSVAVLVRRCFTKLVSPSRLFLHDTICRSDIDFGEDRRQEWVAVGCFLPFPCLPSCPL
jgi:hypothetical protein